MKMPIPNIQVSSSLVLPIDSYEPEKFPLFSKEGKTLPKSQSGVIKVTPSGSGY